MAQQIERGTRDRGAAVVAAPDVPISGRSRREKRQRTWLLLLPGMVIAIVGLLLPVLQVVRVSLWRTQGFILQRDVSADQYSTMLGDASFWNTAGNTAQ